MKLELNDSEFTSMIWGPIVFTALLAVFFGMYSCDKSLEKPPQAVEKAK